MAQQSWTGTPSANASIRPDHFNELQDAINAWENAYNISETSFGNTAIVGSIVKKEYINEMKTALENLETLTSSTLPNAMITRTPQDEVAVVDITNIRNNVNYLQENKCYLCHTCDTYVACTCNATCDGYSACSCDATCYNESPCTCDNLCYGHSACNCNATCYEYVACSCDSTCYGYSACSCNSTCYGYSTCLCNSRCYSSYTEKSGCSQCHNACYSQGSGCSCNSTCYGYSACSCNSSCYEYNACSCDATCDSYSACR